MSSKYENVRNPMRYTEEALAEKEKLKEINKLSTVPRTMKYLKITGPGFLQAAFTLGAGSFASSVSLGAFYGYSMLWVPLYSFAFGLFMLALATRFVTSSELPVIQAQNKYHGKFFGTVITGFIACFAASLIYSFGQYALGADAVKSAFALAGVNIPKSISWVPIFLLSAPLTLLYGSGVKAVKRVENFIKLLILTMLIVFAAVLFTTGINFPAMIKGLLIPTIPSGIEGIIMIIASLTATIGVMDWILFNNAQYSRGFSEEHESLGRFDAVMGGLLPTVLILTFVSMAFAEAFAGKPGIPENSGDLATALVSIIPSLWIQIGFYIGIIALIVSTMVGLSIVAATTFCQSFELEPDPKSWYWKALLLAPHIGIFGAFAMRPVAVIITVAALQSVFNWLSGMSWYLLGNDIRFLGKRVIQSRFFNVGILLTISVLNIVFVTFVLSKIGVWPQ